MVASRPGPSDFLRQGRFFRIWEGLVVVAVFVSLYFVCLDLGLWLRWHNASAHYTSSAHAWAAYVSIQLASKIPISYRYSPRGWWAVADLVGFSAAVSAALLFGFGVGCPQPVAIGLASVVGLWLALGVVYSVDPSTPGGSRAHRIYCAVVALLFPGLPMLGAAVALAAA